MRFVLRLIDVFAFFFFWDCSQDVAGQHICRNRSVSYKVRKFFLERFFPKVSSRKCCDLLWKEACYYKEDDCGDKLQTLSCRLSTVII